MSSRPGGFRPVQRVAAIGAGIVDTFLRDNKVIPPVMALLALLVFAWIVTGTFVGEPDEKQVSNRASLAQLEDPAAPQDSPAPDVENRDVDSYAAYEVKDPFRQLLEPAEATAPTTPQTTGEDTTGDGNGDGNGGGNGGGNGDGNGGGNGGTGEPPDDGTDGRPPDNGTGGGRDRDPRDSPGNGGGKVDRDPRRDPTGGGGAGRDRDDLFESGGDLRAR